MRALAPLIDGMIPVLDVFSYFVPLQPTAPALLGEIMIPVLGALLLGVLIGILVRWQKPLSKRRVLFGVLGGLIGVFIGYIVAGITVPGQGAVTIAVCALCTFLGAVGGAAFIR